MSDVAQLPKRQPLPNRTLLTAGELLLWLAFGDHYLSDPIGAAAFLDTWGFDPSAEEGSEAKLRLALREAAGMLDAWEEDAFTKSPHPPVWLNAARRLVTAALERLGITAVEALGVLYVQAQYLRQRQKAMRTVEAAVIEALVSDQLQVLASPAHPKWPQTAAGPARRVPADFFATIGVGIGLDGTISAPCNPGYVHARFRTAEVLEVWPPPPAPVDPQQERERARVWMLENVTEYANNQRDLRVTECKNALGVPRAAALYGWNRLPETITGKPRGAATHKSEDKSEDRGQSEDVL